MTRLEDAPPVRSAQPARARHLSGPLRDPPRFSQRRHPLYAHRILVSTLLAGHNVGLEEIDHGLFNVYFGPVWLGHFFEHKRCILDSSDPRRNSKQRSGASSKGRRTVKKVR